MTGVARVLGGAFASLMAQLGLMLAWIFASRARGMSSGEVIHAMDSPEFRFGSLILGFLTEVLGGWLACGRRADGAMARAATVGGILTLLECGWIALESRPIAPLAMAGLFTPLPAALLGGYVARWSTPRGE